jgi:hypothetical protein
MPGPPRGGEMRASRFAFSGAPVTPGSADQYAVPMRLPAIIAFTTASLLLAGCVGGNPTAQPTHTSRPIPSATVAAPSPTPVDRMPALADLVVTERGLGPLHIGDLPGATDMIKYSPDECALEGEGAGPGFVAARWISTYPVNPAIGRPYFVEVHDGRIAAISARSPALKTASGIGIGSAIEQVETAYPTLAEGIETDYSYVRYVVHDGAMISFEFQKPGFDSEERDNRVVYLLVAPYTGKSPDPVAFTDGGVGSCL